MTDTLEEIARETWSELLDMGLANLGRKSALETITKALKRAVEMENESCAKACEAEERIYLSPEYATGQPLSSVSERGACRSCARAIRARKVSP